MTDESVPRLGQSSLDGRIYLLFVLTIYFSAIYTSSFFTDYRQFWRYLGVSTLSPSFYDLRFLIAGWECSRKGLDVLVSNPCDPGIRTRGMNYPRIWLVLAPLGINQSQAELLGWSLGLSFFIAVIFVLGRLKAREAIICSAVLLSPAVMLGVERGNTDLLIFILLTFSVLSLRGNTFSFALGYLLILVSAVLKLFPAFAILAVVKERRKNLIVVVLLFSAAFIAYVVYTLEDLFLIQDLMRRSTYMSYGALNFLHILTDLISPSIYELHHKLLTLLSLVLAFLLIVIAFLYIRVSGSKSLNTEHITAFRIGAGIYIGTFMFMENWDYRLIFLIFTLPQMFVWIKKESEFRNESIVALTAMVLTLWMSRWKYNFVIGEILNPLLFVCFLVALHHTLPEFVRIPIQRSIEYINSRKRRSSTV